VFLIRNLCAFALVVTFLGCSDKPSRLAAPDVDPGDVAKKAIELYDKDGDGRLANKELSNGLKAFAKTADTNSDGALEEAEISKRLEEHVSARVGLQDVGGIVYLNNRPLIGATIRFIPDEAFGDVLSPAAGITDDVGFVELVIEGSDLPGVKPGFYRIEVSKKNGSRELVPSKYNTASELGEEIGPDVSQGGWKLELKSR